MKQGKKVRVKEALPISLFQNKRSDFFFRDELAKGLEKILYHLRDIESHLPQTANIRNK